MEPCALPRPFPQVYNKSSLQVVDRLLETVTLSKQNQFYRWLIDICEQELTFLQRISGHKNTTNLLTKDPKDF